MLCVVQVEVSASGRSHVQSSPTNCGVSEFDRETSIRRRPWPLWAFVPLVGGEYYLNLHCKNTKFIFIRTLSGFSSVLLPYQLRPSFLSNQNLHYYYYYYYLLQLVCYPVVVVILHVNKHEIGYY